MSLKTILLSVAAVVAVLEYASACQIVDGDYELRTSNVHWMGLRQRNHGVAKSVAPAQTTTTTTTPAPSKSKAASNPALKPAIATKPNSSFQPTRPATTTTTRPTTTTTTTTEASQPIDNMDGMTKDQAGNQ